MHVALTLLAFAVSTALALAASAVLIVRLERIGARLSLAEAALGIVAALAADTPEISTAVAALAQGQHDVGVGVILGSNVAKLALLLGLAAMVAGVVRLDRRVVLLEGVVAVPLAVATVLVVDGTASPATGLTISAVFLIPYVVVAAMSPAVRARLPVPVRLRGTISGTLEEEEAELDLHPRRGGAGDVGVATVALVLVVASSVVLERTGSDLGTAWHLSDLVVGAVLLAVVTSIPNAVAAVHLARRGRGAATLSTTTNSNSLNVVLGLLLPAALIGLGGVTDAGVLTAWWYLGLTTAALAWAALRRGVTRLDGIAIGIAYVVFVVLLLR